MMDPAQKNLTFLYPPFRVMVAHILGDMEAQGLPMKATETIRSFKRQKELFALGRTIAGRKVTGAKPGLTCHHYGIAADLCFLGKELYPDPESVQGRAKWEKFHKVAEYHGMAARSTFPGVIDWPHIENKQGMIVERMYDLYKEGGILKVWQAFDIYNGIKEQNSWMYLVKEVEAALNQ